MPHEFACIPKRSLSSSLCSFVFFVVCLSVSCAGPPKHATWSNATGAEQHEQLMWKAVHEKDWTEFERHLSPTFIGVNAQGAGFDRAGWVAYWKSAQPVEFSLGEQNVQPEGADTKITYILQLQRGGDQRGGEQRGGEKASGGSGFRVISIWQHMKKGWMLTATSITPVQGG